MFAVLLSKFRLTDGYVQSPSGMPDGGMLAGLIRYSLLSRLLHESIFALNATNSRSRKSPPLSAVRLYGALGVGESVKLKMSATFVLFQTIPSVITVSFENGYTILIIKVSEYLLLSERKY